MISYSVFYSHPTVSNSILRFSLLINQCYYCIQCFLFSSHHLKLVATQLYQPVDIFYLSFSNTLASVVIYILAPICSSHWQIWWFPLTVSVTPCIVSLVSTLLAMFINMASKLAVMAADLAQKAAQKVAMAAQVSFVFPHFNAVRKVHVISPCPSVCMYARHAREVGAQTLSNL